MSERSVFYASNSHSDVYTANTRGSFTSLIDENEFDYLDSSQLCVAVKSVTFENKFNIVTSRLGYPNMIIIQDIFDVIPASRPTSQKPLWEYSALFKTPRTIDTSSGLDYYLFDEQDPQQKSYGEGRNFVLRNFTDVKIVSANFKSFIGGKTTREFPKRVNTQVIVHNIYLHDSSYKSPGEFISYLNYVYANIEYDLAHADNPMWNEKNFKLFSLIGDRVIIHLKEKENLHIFLSDELRRILGFRVNALKNEDASNLRELIAENFQDKQKMSVYYPYLPPEPAEAASSYTAIGDIGFNIDNITNNPQANTILDMEFKDNEMYFNVNIKMINKFPHFGFIQADSDLKLSECTTDILGLRTNLKEPDLFRNGMYDTQVEFFNVKDHAGGVQICEIKSPSFFDTTVEKLANAKFELIDINTNTVANFTLGTPTHIQVVSKNKPAMSKRFNVFLDSSDEYSKKIYPKNDAHDFTIRLPERLEFNSDWEVALKHIFIGNDLFNVYRDSCWIDFQITRSTPKQGQPTDMPNWSRRQVFNYRRTSADKYVEMITLKKKIRAENIRLNTAQDFCNYFQNQFDMIGTKLEIGLKKERIYISRKETEQYDLVDFRLTLSPYLCNILGFTRGTSKSHKLRFEEKREYVATYAPNISLLVPTNFIVLCDVVSESIFGAKSVNILKLLSTNFDPSKEMIDLTFHQDEFLDLNLKEFSSIKIQIVDTTGNLVQSEKSYPTRCQLQFAKKRKF